MDIAVLAERAIERARAVAPSCVGLQIVDPVDPSTWVVELRDGGSDEQRAAVLAALADLWSPTADDVRAECRRRMRELVGARDDGHLEQIIANGSREAIRLQSIRLGIPGATPAREWTDAEAARAGALTAVDAAIDALRARSNAMEPAPPADYTDDARWS